MPPKECEMDLSPISRYLPYLDWNRDWQRLDALVQHGAELCCQSLEYAPRFPLQPKMLDFVREAENHISLFRVPDPPERYIIGCEIGWKNLLDNLGQRKQYALFQGE